jgi:glycosyltransferase involved in cell wall biosynthesis
MPNSAIERAPGAAQEAFATVAGSIIIPAHNEEASIGHCLSALLRNARPGEFEVIVVCNGCNDNTAGAARAFGSMVRVIEIEVGSKVVAVNLGNKAARFHPRLYLDADLELPTESARALLSATTNHDCLAAIGRMETDVADLPWLMRQYYAVWTRHNYLKNGKFGGAYALSESGSALIGTLPPVINDDEYVRRRIPPDQVRVLSDCSFRAQMPRTFRDLTAVRTRVHRGNRQLRQLARASSASIPVPPRGASLRNLLKTALTRPDMWVGVVVYILVNGVAKLRSRTRSTSWGRDESSRRLNASRSA